MTIPVDPKRTPWPVWAGIGLFTLVVGGFCILRHYNLWTRGLDFGLEMQVLWNTAQGRWFESSYEVQNYLGDHTAFTDLIFAGVYFIFGSAESILIAQALSYALGAVFVYGIAMTWLDGSVPLALAAAATYLAQPAAGGALGYDFHSMSICPLFALGSFYYFQQKRWALGWAGLALVMLTREDCCLTAAAVGVLIFGCLRHRKTGVGASVAGVAGFLVMLAVVLPHFRLGESSDTLARYSHFGSSIGQIARTVLLNPLPVVGHLLDDPRRILWPLILIGPWALTPLRSFWGMLAIGLILAPGVLSSGVTQYTMSWQYPFTSLPIITIAALDGLRHLKRTHPAWFTGGKQLRRVLMVWGLFLLAANVHWNNFIYHRYVLSPEPKRHEVAEMRAQLPTDASISVSQSLAGHFYDRRHYRVYPQYTWPADRFPALTVRQAEYILIDRTCPYLLRNDLAYPPDHYNLIAETRRLQLFRRLSVSP